MPSKRTELSAVSFADEKYVIGGQSKMGRMKLVEIYNTIGRSIHINAGGPARVNVFKLAQPKMIYFL